MQQQIKRILLGSINAGKAHILTHLQHSGGEHENWRHFNDIIISWWFVRNTGRFCRASKLRQNTKTTSEGHAIKYHHSESSMSIPKHEEEKQLNLVQRWFVSIQGQPNLLGQIYRVAGAAGSHGQLYAGLKACKVCSLFCWDATSLSRGSSSQHCGHWREVTAAAILGGNYWREKDTGSATDRRCGIHKQAQKSLIKKGKWGQPNIALCKSWKEGKQSAWINYVLSQN